MKQETIQEILSLNKLISKMKQETIKFTIKQDGTVTEEVMGTEGDVCIGLTKDIESRLGDLEDRVYNSDYYKNYQPATLDQDVTL